MYAFCLIIQLFWTFYINNASNDEAYAVPLYKAAAEEGAVCIDGSVPYYYFLPGAETRKWVISFNGGGWCAGNDAVYASGLLSEPNYPQSCFTRSFNERGSSLTYAQYTQVDNSSPMSRSKENNPLMYNWTVAILAYCDGASFSGNKDEPYIKNVNNTEYKVYSRGHRILKAVYEDLLFNRGLNNASDIIIHGSSAGALAVWLHADWINDNLLKPNMLHDNYYVSGLPDSGFFLEYNGYDTNNGNILTNFSNSLKWIFYNGNMTFSSLNQDCINYYKTTNEEWKCIFAQNVAPFIKIPFFALNSEYDAWQTGNVLGSLNNEIINEYGNNFTSLMINNFLKYNSNENDFNKGAYIDSCHHHCGNWNAMHNGDYTQATAHRLFYLNKVWKINNNSQSTEYAWFQNQSYPCQSCCK